jgi:hypothetical protein
MVYDIDLQQLNLGQFRNLKFLDEIPFKKCIFLHFFSIELSQPHFGLSVRMKLTLPKVGTWSPPGLPKIQSLITRVKTPCIGVFFILLERS